MVMRQKYQDILYRYLLLLLIGPVILVSSSKSQEELCGKISIDDCSTKVQAILNLISLSHTSDKYEVDNLCSNAEEGYNCSSKLLSTSGCLVGRDRDWFDNFKYMTEQIILTGHCWTNGQIRRKRESKQDSATDACSLKQKEALECCETKTKFGELSIPKILSDSLNSCCTVANYGKCTDAVLQHSCGDDPTKSGVNYVRRVLREQLENACKKTVNFLERDSKACSAPVPVCAGSKIGSFVEFTVLICLLFVMRFSHF